MECLEIDAHSPDPRRARVAKELAGEGPVRRSWGPADPVLGAVDRLLVLVDELCAQTPQVLVVDDLQWADEASVLVWHRLCAATRQLPCCWWPRPGRRRTAPSSPSCAAASRRATAWCSTSRR